MKIPSLFTAHRNKQNISLLRGELFILAPAVATGKLITEDDIMIDSKFSGSITSSGHLTIGPNAAIIGNVAGRTIHHQGALEGEIHAQDAAIIQGGSHLKKSKVTGLKVDIQPGSQLIDVNVTTN